VNAAPTTSGIANVTVNEDSGNSNIDLHAAFDDVDNLDSELTYSIVGNTNVGLFSSAAVNAVTGELILDYAADMNGSSQISMRATDPSGALVDTLFTVTVTPVNDAPVIVKNTGIIAPGNNSMTIGNAELSSADIDNLDAALLYTVTALPAGDLMINGVVATLGSSFTEADLINNRLSYRAGGASLSDHFEFTVTDGSGGILPGNSFNILVQIGATGPSDPIDPAPDPELPDPVTTPTDPVVVNPVDPVDPPDGFGGGFTPIGTSKTPGPQPDPTPALEATVPKPEIEDKATEEVVEELSPESLTKIESFEGPRITSKLADYDIPSIASLDEIKVKSIDALLVAMGEMNEQLEEQFAESKASIQLSAAAVSSSGVALTAGAVAWVLRSGALMTSLMATIPVWKGYDPLPILKYKSDEEDEEKAEDKIPTSLEEARKIKALKEKIEKENQIDFLFGEEKANV